LSKVTAGAAKAMEEKSVERTIESFMIAGGQWPVMYEIEESVE